MKLMAQGEEGGEISGALSGIMAAQVIASYLLPEAASPDESKSLEASDMLMGMSQVCPPPPPLPVKVWRAFISVR